MGIKAVLWEIYWLTVKFTGQSGKTVYNYLQI